EILRAFRPDSCIASTAVAIDVLERFGLKSQALAVEVSVFNLPFVEHLRREGTLPQTPDDVRRWQQAGCHAVDIDRKLKRPGGWSGHLVAIAADRWLVDLSIDQVNRPQQGILLAPLAWPVKKAFLRGQQPQSIDVGQVVLRYRAYPA